MILFNSNNYINNKTMIGGDFVIKDLIENNPWLSRAVAIVLGVLIAYIILQLGG